MLSLAAASAVTLPVFLTGVMWWSAAVLVTDGTPPASRTSAPRLRGLRQRRWGCIHALMTVIFNIGDRARLRERFFGATHAVLARL